jgi:hypothetical protein
MQAEDVATMERLLCVTLPADYKKAMVDFPWPDYAGGTDLSLFDDASLNIKRTFEYRAGYMGAPPWPADFVHVGDDDDACPYALCCRDGTIVKTDHGNLTKKPLVTYTNIGFLVNEIQSGLKR